MLTLPAQVRYWLWLRVDQTKIPTPIKVFWRCEAAAMFWWMPKAMLVAL